MGVTVVIALFGYHIISSSVSAVGILKPTLRTSGEPDTTEVTIRVRNVFLAKHATVSSCDKPSSGHWTCAVRLANGPKGTAHVVWYGRAQKLGVSVG
jgi:hypothetical protein